MLALRSRFTNPLSPLLRASLFDDFYKSLGISTSLDDLSVPVDVKTTDEAIIVTADVPGISKEDLNVTIENGELTISGSRESECKEVCGGQIHERAYGSFSRSFTIPQSIDPNSVKATLQDGVLQLIINRTEPTKGRKIEIV